MGSVAVWAVLPVSVKTINIYGYTLSALVGYQWWEEGGELQETDHDTRSFPFLSKSTLVEDGASGHPDHESPELACSGSTRREMQR